MEKYRLKQWYPNLHLAWSTTDNYEYDRESNRMYNRTRWGTIPITAPYLHPDFWELIEEEKPLFVTEDGVEVFSDIDNLFAINLTYFSKTQNTLRSSRWLIDNPSYKVFSLESNADEYIWRNKRLFSYNDIEKFQSGGEGVFYDVKAIAKRRSEG